MEFGFFLVFFEVKNWALQAAQEKDDHNKSTSTYLGLGGNKRIPKKTEVREPLYSIIPSFLHSLNPTP